MPFVQGKCESCGGILTVDPSLKAANCPFCGAAYVVQDSINYYNTTIKVESMHADVVNVIDESSSDARVKAGEAYLKIGKFELAEKEYLYVIEVAPQNHLGWLGLLEARTNNYSKRIKSASELKALNEIAVSVSTLAPNGSGNALIEKWNNYLKKEEQQNSEEKAPIIEALAESEKELKNLADISTEVTGQINQKESRLNVLVTKHHVDDTNRKSLPGVFIVLGILAVFFGITLLIAASMIPGDPAIPDMKAMAITLFVICGGFVLAAVIAKNNYNWDKKEAITLRNDIEIQRNKLAEINKQKETVQSALSSQQKLLSEYN